MADEKRLIDANELKRRMLAFATSIKRGFLSIEAIIDRIDTSPTVDAVEVVHGKWEVIEDDYLCMTTLKCSVCGEEWAFEDYDGCLPPFQTYHYCPNCGAKMDGDGNGP